MGDQRGAMGAYDDEPTAEELEFLRSEEANAAVPPAEDDDSNPVTPEMAAAEKGVDTQGNAVAAPAEGAPAPAPAPDAAAAQPAPTEQTDDQRFAAFLEQHKGKSPEEIARLAFQQQQRANQAGFQARQNKEQLEAIQQRATASIQRIAQEREAAAQRRQQFNQQLQEDPDAATRALHDRLATDEDRRFSEEEFAARREMTVSTIAAAIPTFNMDATRSFGAEMNYTSEEMDRVTDPRDLATLHFASLSGRLIKAGVIDLQGNLIAAPPPVASDHPALNAPAPVQTLSSAPARAHNGGATVATQLENILAMSDADMDKFERENPGVLQDLLRKAG